MLLVGFMPSGAKRAAENEGCRVGVCADRPPSAWRNRDVRLLFIASMLMWTCNTFVYHRYAAVYHRRSRPAGRVGRVLIGTAAGLEIPAMLLAGYYVKRFGKRNMMLLAVVAGVLFYLGLTVLESKPA